MSGEGRGAPCCARPGRGRACRVEPASFCSGSDAACQRYTFPPPRGFPGLAGFSRAEVRGLLLSMPPGRFVISSTFPDFDSALDSAPGWLDLFSGSRGFAKSLAASAPCWVLCLDISHGEDEDLLSENLQNLLLKLVSAKAFAGVSAGPVCSSFSSAITPAWRTRSFPQGKPDLRQDQRDKVLAGNKMLEFSFELVQCAAAGSLTFWIENPQGSWFWKQPAWEEIKAEVRWDDFLCDFCVFGTKWRKATRFRTNGQLGGARMRCPGGHSHLVLRGRTRSLEYPGPNLPSHILGALLLYLLLRAPRTLDGWEISGPLISLAAPSALGRGSGRLTTLVRADLLRDGLQCSSRRSQQ